MMLEKVAKLPPGVMNRHLPHPYCGPVIIDHGNGHKKHDQKEPLNNIEYPVPGGIFQTHLTLYAFHHMIAGNSQLHETMNNRELGRCVVEATLLPESSAVIDRVFLVKMA